MATRPAVSGKKAAATAGAAKKKSAKAAASPTKTPSRAAPQKKAAAATITLKTVFEAMAEGHNIPKKQANALLAAMVESVTKHLKNGDRIRMNGLGILEVKDRPARQGRNPATGETIQIAASKKVAFRPAKELKEAV
jgi:DNA-binding protein HU-beta